jgi:hypothetical protein
MLTNKTQDTTSSFSWRVNKNVLIHLNVYKHLYKHSGLHLNSWFYTGHYQQFIIFK